MSLHSSSDFTTFFSGGSVPPEDIFKTSSHLSMLQKNKPFSEKEKGLQIISKKYSETVGSA
jgi:hypothetical protein